MYRLHPLFQLSMYALDLLNVKSDYEVLCPEANERLLNQDGGLWSAV